MSPGWNFSGYHPLHWRRRKLQRHKMESGFPKQRHPKAPKKRSWCHQMGVSKNRGTQKWMVYKGNSIKMDDLGVPLFSETPKSSSVQFRCCLIVQCSLNQPIVHWWFGIPVPFSGIQTTNHPKPPINHSHRIHGTIVRIFTYKISHKNHPKMPVNIPVPWILRSWFPGWIEPLPFSGSQSKSCSSTKGRE